MTGTEFVFIVVGISIALSVIMAGAWAIWRRTGNSGWVDTVWTMGLGAVGLVGALLPSLSTGAVTWRQAAVAGLVTLWSARLGLHIALRTHGIRDDPRYEKLQQAWGGNASRQMFRLLQKQALVTIPLGLSMTLAAWNPSDALRAQDILAIAILVVAIAGEAASDAQLRRFRAQPGNRNRIRDKGLWAWSRHPNYFFEWLGWLAYPLLAIDYTGTYVWGWFALIGPACMYWLLVHVSGVPPLEKHMLATRGDAFRDYQKRTSAFFPVPPSPLRSA